MDRAVNQGVPKVIYIIIVAILASMYYYAAFVDSSAPEKTVENFYAAYFDRDFDTVAENLSVFWSVQFLPQYQKQSPAQLIENRDAIEKEISQVISQIEAGNQLPAGLSIEVNPTYTRQSKNSALVAYTFYDKGQATGMELAILINESNHFRIFNMSPVRTQDLDQITDKDMEDIDKALSTLLEK